MLLDKMNAVSLFSSKLFAYDCPLFNVHSKLIKFVIKDNDPAMALPGVLNKHGCNL